MGNYGSEHMEKCVLITKQDFTQFINVMNSIDFPRPERGDL